MLAHNKISIKDFLDQAGVLLLCIVVSHTCTVKSLFSTNKQTSLRGGTTKQSPAFNRPDCAGDCFVPRNDDVVLAIKNMV